MCLCSFLYFFLLFDEYKKYYPSMIGTPLYFCFYYSSQYSNYVLCNCRISSYLLFWKLVFHFSGIGFPLLMFWNISFFICLFLHRLFVFLVLCVLLLFRFYTIIDFLVTVFRNVSPTLLQILVVYLLSFLCSFSCSLLFAMLQSTFLIPECYLYVYRYCSYVHFLLLSFFVCFAICRNFTYLVLVFGVFFC